MDIWNEMETIWNVVAEIQKKALPLCNRPHNGEKMAEIMRYSRPHGNVMNCWILILPIKEVEINNLWNSLIFQSL